MAEQLFRLAVVRPPHTPNPRYPPIVLAQESPFQVQLGREVVNHADPRSSLESNAANYVASADFATLNLADSANIKLDAAAEVIESLVESESGMDSAAVVSHDVLLTAFKKAFEEDNLASLSFDSLEIRMKDSIVALRLLGIEEARGNLAALTSRLRTIDVLQKLNSDANFPFDELDLRKYFLRPLLAPTFAELRSILSTAKAREAAAAQAEADRKAAQDRINAHFAARLDLTKALRDVRALPRIHRQAIKPKTFKPSPPKVDLSKTTLVTHQFQLINNLANLTVKSFERGLQLDTERPPMPHLFMQPTATGAAQPQNLTTTASPFVDNLSSVTAAISPLVSMSHTLLESLKSIPSQPDAPPELIPPTVVPYTLDAAAEDALPSDTRGVFKQLSLDIKARPIDSSTRILTQRLAQNARDLDAEYAAHVNPVAKVQVVGNTIVQYKKPHISPWAGALKAGLFKPPLLRMPNTFERLPRFGGQVKVLGIADLLVVKQQLIGYEGGDVAYIENLLRGESKIREIGTSTSLETELTTELETEESKETDVTKAERFEVGRESDKTIKEDESVKAGVTVSASYGPTVSISASASYSNDRSSTEATKAASKYAQDITTKVTDKISKRVLQRTITRTRTESTTKDTHTLANTGGTHISGVYQWLNKVYQAQMWNYGKRTMLDFMIPEPGAFYLDKQSDPEVSTDKINAVGPYGKIPTQIDVDNYMQDAVMYGVTDITDPPPEMSRATASYAAGKDQPMAKADKISIPAGFEVTGISVTAVGVKNKDADVSFVTVTCGQFEWSWNPKEEQIGTVTTTTDYWLWKDVDVQPIMAQLDTSEAGQAGFKDIQHQQVEIPWSTVAAYMDSFAVTVELMLERTDEAFKLWQRNTWAKIRAASDKIIQAQNEAIEKARFNASLAFQGRNPEKNKAIMRNEIKKNCITIMTDSHFDNFDAIQETTPTGSKLAISEIDLSESGNEGLFVRFFEQAFEWEEMTWMLYPYFWGRKAHWYKRVDYEDEDPEFEKFIQAGFARANVPVRPGFEGALEHFFATGKVWNGGPLPGVSSQTFLPLAQEIQESLGKKETPPTKYGDSWLVKVPTNLIRLRHDDKPPVWKKDQVTGEWVEEKDGTIP